MSEVKTESSPPPTATTTTTEPETTTVSSTSVSAKRERNASPEVDASAPSKKVKGENGEASTTPAPTVGDQTAVVENKKQEQTGSTKTNANGEKMDDVQASGTDAGASGSSSSLAVPPPSVPAAPVQAAEPPVQQISMRCLIVTQDASIIIGRAGAHVNEIRERSNARVTVSESIVGNPERILNVSGALDAVAKCFGLIVRRINDEPFDVASVPGSRAVTIKFIIPNSRMGSVIGKGGAKIKEIQEASGARLNASEAMLPGSTERVLSVSGVADAVHIAVYYIGTILLEFNERNPGAATGLYRQQGARGGGGGGPAHHSPYTPNGGGDRGGPGPGGHGPPPGAQTQQIFIPNAFVGAIIGKGGVKINEIRQQSSCQIRVTDPGTAATPGAVPNPDERLVTITGMPHHINTAVQLLYARLEQEKQKTQSPI